MKCIILAAGYATRLYPLTENYPKPLLEVAGKPILDWLVDDLETGGMVDEYIVVTNHKFAAHFSEWAKGKPEKISVVDDGTFTNETRLGAVKDIQFAIDRLGVVDEMLVLAGDNLLDFSFNRFISFAKEKQSSCIMRYYEPSEEKLRKCGVVAVDENDKVMNMAEKPEKTATHWCCPPFYYFTKSSMLLISKGIASGCGTDAPGSFIAWLCNQADVYAMKMPGKRYDIGNLKSYRQVQEEYKGIC